MYEHMEIFLAMRHEVMFMRDECFPTLSKLGNLGRKGGGGGWVTLIIPVDEGNLKLTFAKWEGGSTAT